MFSKEKQVELLNRVVAENVQVSPAGHMLIA